MFFLNLFAERSIYEVNNNCVFKKYKQMFFNIVLNVNKMCIQFSPLADIMDNINCYNYNYNYNYNINCNLWFGD